jgi:hypothetical protein
MMGLPVDEIIPPCRNPDRVRNCQIRRRDPRKDPAGREDLQFYRREISILLFFPFPRSWKTVSSMHTDGISPIIPRRKATWTCGNPLPSFLKDREELTYSPAEILVASGGRPLIYSLFRTLIDKGDKVIYAVPSWNNNHYTHLNGGEHVVIEATAENNFMPTADALRPHVGVLRCSVYVRHKIRRALLFPKRPVGHL